MENPDNVEAETAKTLASMTQISGVSIGEKEHEEEKDERVYDDDESEDEEEEVIEPKKVNKGQKTDTDTSDSSNNEPTSELKKPVLNVGKRLAKSPPTIKDQRNIIERSEAMNDLFIEYADAVKQKFDLLDIRSEKNNKSNISNESIVESSKEPIVVPMKVFEDEPCKNLRLLAEVPYKYGMSTMFYKDMTNFDVFISPLKNFILKSDRYTLRQAAAQKIPDDQQRPGLSNSAFELAYVNSISRFSNSQIRDHLYHFFISVFDSREHNHIKELLQDDRSKAAMLINRSASSNDNINNPITTAHIMGAVLFATDGRKNLLIDFLCAAPSHIHHGYGILLLHIAQVLGMEVIRQEAKDNDEVPSVVPTYLSCNNDLFKLYTWLGFEQVEYKEFLSPNGSLHYFGQRMDIGTWIKDDESIRLKCMRIRKWCPRWLSRVSPPALDIESSLYRQTYARFKVLTTPKRISNRLKIQFENILDSIKFRPIEQNDVSRYQSCKNIIQFLKLMEKEVMVFKVGTMMKKCFLSENGILQPPTHSFSISTILALQRLELRVISEDLDESDLDKIGVWILVQCSSCKKHCYCRKLKKENFVTFMTKVIYSIWFVHVFGFKNKLTNEWYNCNSDWNQCPGRRGDYLHDFKYSLNHDFRHLVSDESRQKRLFIWRRYVESYFELMKENLIKCYDALVIFGLACKEESQKERQSSTTRPTRHKRKCATKNNLETAKDNQRFTEMSEKESKTFKARQRSRKKQENEIKLARHTAEEMWQVTMENDLNLQLSFRYIQYVDCLDTRNLMDVSKEYLKSREEHKDNDYIDHHGDLHKKEHFVAYTFNKRSAYVIEESWFKVYDADMNFLSDRITLSTINKCRRHPNAIFELSNEDKNRIKKHVDYTLHKCQIHRIKRVRTNPNDDNDYETVTFFEEKSNEEDQHTITKHKSSSKYDFIGFDANGRSHRLSRDWLELNFKGGPYHSWYKETLQLKPGQNLNVPDGYSNLKKNGIEIDIKDRGVETKYVQNDNEASCLFVSLANTLDFVGDKFGGLKIMMVCSKLYQSGIKKYPNMKDILHITNENRYHEIGETKFKFMIQKVKKPCVDMILNDKTTKFIYHCTLANNHAICLHGDWIFDPVVKFTYKRSVSNFRKAAEATDWEGTSTLIKQCYKYVL